MMEMRTLLPTVLLVLLHFLSGWRRSEAAAAAPSEFLQSFLKRPKFLPNAAGARGPREPLSDDTLSFSVIVDNWSKYSLVYTQYAVTEGVLDARDDARSFSFPFNPFCRVFPGLVTRPTSVLVPVAKSRDKTQCSL